MLVPTVPHSSTLCQPVPSAVVVVRVDPAKSLRDLQRAVRCEEGLDHRAAGGGPQPEQVEPVPVVTLTLVLMHNWLTVVPRSR